MVEMHVTINLLNIVRRPLCLLPANFRNLFGTYTIHCGKLLNILQASVVIQTALGGLTIHNAIANFV